MEKKKMHQRTSSLPSHHPFLYFSFAAAYIPPFFSASTTIEQRLTVPLFRVQSSSFASCRSPFSGHVRPSPVAFAAGADTAVKVYSGKKPVTRIRLFVEGDVEEKLTIHIQHLSSLPAFLILSNELAYGSGTVNYKHHIKPLVWRHCSHVSTACEHSTTQELISEPFPSSLDPLAEAPKTLYVDTR